MLKRSIGAAVALVALVSAMPAGANNPVTIILRSGERITGDFQGVHRNGTAYVRASFEKEERPQIGQIALFDFVSGGQNLPANELGEARGSQHLLVLRDGSIHKGQMIEFGGTDTAGQMLLVFRTESGEEKRVDAKSIARLYLGSFPGAAPTPPSPSRIPDTPGQRTVTVRADQRWVDTGFTVRTDDRVVFDASGEVNLNPSEKVGPDGTVEMRTVPGTPMPSVRLGALIGRAGEAEPFIIGRGVQPIRMNGTGRLYLAVNDSELGDNSGEFVVRISPQQSSNPFRRRR